MEYFKEVIIEVSFKAFIKLLRVIYPPDLTLGGQFLCVAHLKFFLPGISVKVCLEMVPKASGQRQNIELRCIVV